MHVWVFLNKNYRYPIILFATTAIAAAYRTGVCGTSYVRRSLLVTSIDRKRHSLETGIRRDPIVRRE